MNQILIYSESRVCRTMSLSSTLMSYPTKSSTNYLSLYESMLRMPTTFPLDQLQSHLAQHRHGKRTSP